MRIRQLTGEASVGYYVDSTMRRFPLLTIAVIVVTCLVFLVELESATCLSCGGLVPLEYTRGGPATRLVSYMFLHDPNDVWHIVGNMFMLAILGAVVESRLGHFGFGAVFFLSGIAGGLMHVAVDPTSSSPLVGASGGIFGLLAVAAVLQPRLVGFAFLYAGFEVWRAFSGSDGSASFGCHIGGFAAGVVIALFLRMIGSSEPVELSSDDLEDA